MGTSVSHRSPETHNWHAAHAGYISDAVPIERVTQEVWRAAINQPEANLALTLAEPVVAQCLGMMLRSESPVIAVHDVTRLIALSGESNFATDIATRAAVTGFQASGDRRMNFVSSLFSEAVDYLVSRDLPGYVGLGDRIKDVSSSIRFKQDIKRRVIEIVQGYPAPENVESTASEWRAYVGLISDALAKR